MLSRIREGYVSIPLFHDMIYPVCAPQYLAEHREICALSGLRHDAVLLNLSPYGRSQVAEHMDWEVWLAIHHFGISSRIHEDIFQCQ